MQDCPQTQNYYLQKMTLKYVCFFQQRPFFIILFVCSFRGIARNFCRLLAILFEGPLIEIQKEIHHFVVLGGGAGVKGDQNSEQKICEQTGAPQIFTKTGSNPTPSNPHISDQKARLVQSVFLSEAQTTAWDP